MKSLKELLKGVNDTENTLSMSLKKIGKEKKSMKEKNRRFTVHSVETISLF